MKTYFAKVHIGIPPFGTVTVGEFLEEKHILALGEERLSELVKEKALGVRYESDPQPISPEESEAGPDEHNAEKTTADEETEDSDTEEAGEEGDTEEAEDMTLRMDDLVGESEETEEAEAEEETAQEDNKTEKPNKKRGRKGA